MHTLRGWLTGKQVGREAAFILAGTLGPPHLAEGIPASSLVLIPEDGYQQETVTRPGMMAKLGLYS